MCPAIHTPAIWPTIASRSTEAMAIGTWARPLASRDPSGPASCAPSAAPRKKPRSDSTPTTAPLRKPAKPYATAAMTMTRSRRFMRSSRQHDQRSALALLLMDRADELVAARAGRREGCRLGLARGRQWHEIRRELCQLPVVRSTGAGVLEDHLDLARMHRKGGRVEAIVVAGFDGDLLLAVDRGRSGRSSAWPAVHRGLLIGARAENPEHHHSGGERHPPRNRPNGNPTSAHPHASTVPMGPESRVRRACHVLGRPIRFGGSGRSVLASQGRAQPPMVRTESSKPAVKPQTNIPPTSKAGPTQPDG